MSEFKVEPHTHNVLSRIDVGRIHSSDSGNVRKARGVRRRAKVDIEVFQLDAPTVGDRVFGAEAGRPSGLHPR